MSAELVALAHVLSALLGAMIVLGIELCVIAWRNKWWPWLAALAVYLLAIIVVLVLNVLEYLP